MPFEHACFVSYRHHEQSEIAELFIKDLCTALQNELALMLEEGLFRDTDRLRVGEFYNPALATALCKSACMIMVYTPTYFSKKHTYCAREYRAMEIMEQRRLRMLYGDQIPNKGLIIPIILRGEKYLPPSIKERRNYGCCFTNFQMSFSPISKHPNFEPEVRKIAEFICEQRQALMPFEEDMTSDCHNFSFPTEEEVRPWLETMISPPSPFPFQADRT